MNITPVSSKQQQKQTFGVQIVRSSLVSKTLAKTSLPYTIVKKDFFNDKIYYNKVKSISKIIYNNTLSKTQNGENPVILDAFSRDARNFKFHDSNVLPREFNANNSSLTYVRAINEKFADMFKNVKKEFELRRNLKKIAFIEHLDITVNLDKKIASVIQNVKNNLGKKAYRQRAKLKNA